MNKKNVSRVVWSQPSNREEMATAVKSLDPAARSQRLAIPYNKPNHVDDEVIVTLMLEARNAQQDSEENTYASELLRRITKQVKAHVHKNPGWQRLGGGAEEVIADFSEEIVLSILQDKTVPCHAEVAFGDYVYKRCIDAAAKLYAKKNSAGQSLEEIDSIESLLQHNYGIDSQATKPPDEILMEIEDSLADQIAVVKIHQILQSDDIPELAARAFTFRYLSNLKIESIKDPVTVTSLMGVTEKTATKYINQAIEFIKERLTND